LHSRSTRAAERKCTRTTDVSIDIHSGGAAIHSGGATQDARSGVSSANARDVTAEINCTRTTDIGEDIYSRSANTDAAVMPVPTPATSPKRVRNSESRNLSVQPTSSLPAAKLE